MRLQYCKVHGIAQHATLPFGTCLFYDREIDRNSETLEKCEWTILDCVEIVDIATQLV